jgi:hypothetical protein
MARGWRVEALSKRWWLVVLALVALPLLVEFNTRLAVSRQLFEEEARLKRDIEIEQERSAFLQSYEQYVRSDAYVEWWARVSARMTQPGEVAVAPQTPSNQPDSFAAPAVSDFPRDLVNEWWAVFFASVP